MRGVQKSAWGLAALLMILAPPVRAQEPVKARLTADWWWDASAFAGSMGLSCSVCDGRASGAGAGLGGGIRFGRYAEAGLGTTVFFGSREDVSQRLILIGPVGRIYTSTARRWHVRGSLQWQAYRAAEGTSRLTAGTVALGLGVGWRAQVGKTTELAPYADLLVTPSTGLSLNGNDLTNARFNTVVLGAALRFDRQRLHRAPSGELHRRMRIQRRRSRARLNRPAVVRLRRGGTTTWHVVRPSVRRPHHLQECACKPCLVCVGSG